MTAQITHVVWTHESPTSRETYEARRIGPGSSMWRVKSQYGQSSMSTADLLLELARGLAEDRE